MLRNEWSHFIPEFITDLPLVARHASPSEIIILYYLTIPFGIGSKYKVIGIMGFELKLWLREIHWDQERAAEE